METHDETDAQTVAKLDAQRRLNVICGGVGSTHFIIDITGCYL